MLAASRGLACVLFDFACIYFSNTSKRLNLLSLKILVFMINFKAIKFNSAVK